MVWGAGGGCGCEGVDRDVGDVKLGDAGIAEIVDACCGRGYGAGISRAIV